MQTLLTEGEETTKYDGPRQINLVGGGALMSNFPLSGGGRLRGHGRLRERLRYI